MTCRAPFIFIDVLEKLRKLGAARTEGIFRIPGVIVDHSLLMPAHMPCISL